MGTGRRSGEAGRWAWPDGGVVPVIIAMATVGAALLVAATWHESRETKRFDNAHQRGQADMIAAAIDRGVRERGRDGAQVLGLDDDGEQPFDLAGVTRRLQDAVDTTNARSVSGYAYVDGRGRRVAMVVPEGDAPLSATALAAVDEVARRVARRGEAQASHVFVMGGRRTVALVGPVPAPTGGVFVNITDVGRSSIANVVLAGGASVEVTLRDDEGDVIVGRGVRGADNDSDLTRARVGDTGWTIEARHTPPPMLVPSWAYPLATLLLLAVAAGYVHQQRARRRLERERDRRAAQLGALNFLSTELVGEVDAERQAALVAEFVADVPGVAGVRVSGADGVECLAERGSPGAAADAGTLPLHGARGRVATLAWWGRDEVCPDSRQGIEAAAYVAGGALGTSAQLSAERALSEELQRLDELRRHLLTTVSHELRSPLTAVRGVLTLLLMDEAGTTPRQRDLLQMAEERTMRLGELIRDLFDCYADRDGRAQDQPTARIGAGLSRWGAARARGAGGRQPALYGGAGVGGMG